MTKPIESAIDKVYDFTLCIYSIAFGVVLLPFYILGFIYQRALNAFNKGREL